LAGDVVHHRQAVERQIKSSLGRIGRAVDVKEDAVGGKARDACRMLVADEKLDARIGRRNEIVLGLELGLLRQRDGRREQNAKRGQSHGTCQ
jgi:hypothetical protein